MYKLIAIDMDGTLLDSKKQISTQNLKALMAAKELGVKIVPCTGRPVLGIKRYLDKFHHCTDNDYVVGCSGAAAQNMGTGEIIYETNLNYDDYVYLYKLALNIGIDLSVVTPEKLLTPMINLCTEVEAKINCIPFKLVHPKEITNETIIRRITYVNETKNFVKILKSILNTGKLKNDFPTLNENDNLFADDSNFPKEFFDKYTVLRSSAFAMEILNKKVNKGVTIGKLAEYLGIKKEEVIAIGDSGNDIHMLDYAGLGVAMDNASDSVKGYADFITGTNDENGVANVLEKFVLS